MKLFGSRNTIIYITRNGDNIPNPEVVEVVLAQCHLVDNQYHQKFEILYTVTYIKFYAKLLDVKPINLEFQKTFNIGLVGIITTFRFYHNIYVSKLQIIRNRR